MHHAECPHNAICKSTIFISYTQELIGILVHRYNCGKSYPAFHNIVPVFLTFSSPHLLTSSNNRSIAPRFAISIKSITFAAAFGKARLSMVDYYFSLPCTTMKYMHLSLECYAFFLCLGRKEKSTSNAVRL